jgi:hypothetical protein
MQTYHEETKRKHPMPTIIDHSAYKPPQQQDGVPFLSGRNLCGKFFSKAVAPFLKTRYLLTIRQAINAWLACKLQRMIV